MAIETTADLWNLISRYPADTKVRLGYDSEEVAQLSGEVLNAAEGEIVLILATVQADDGVTAQDPYSGLTEAAATAAEQCDDIMATCDEILDSDDLPDSAHQFAESVKEKVGGIQETIISTDRVTDKQAAALNRMGEGAANWIR